MANKKPRLGGPAENAEAVGEEGMKRFMIDFIDPLFAVAISIGLTNGIMEELWFKEWRFPIGDENFNLWVFLLAFATVVLSWLGYHQSIKNKPLVGHGRFILDVLLVISYAVLLVKFKNLSAVLFLLAIIYLLYIFWDLFKIKEYSKQYNKEEIWKSYRRELVTGFWFIIFFVLWVFDIFGFITRESLLISAYVSTCIYRINKEVDIWGILWNASSNFLFGGKE